MRYVMDSQMGWAALPFILVIGAAYLWVASRLLSRIARVEPREEIPSVTKAA